jgi:RNA polymerase sigma factor (sigma-70 family)
MHAYKTVWKIIYPSVYSLIRNREEAEDIMQDSIIKGFARLNDLKDPEKYIGWQKQICLREALTRLRSVKGSTSLIGDIAQEETEETDVDLSMIDERMIQNQIDKLPEGYRLIIQLHLIEGMKHEEIAVATGIVASTSRSQYFRALQRLKKELLQQYAGQF